MTNTQIAFWNMRETKRHDLAMEDLNADTLAETIRHDKEQEAIGQDQAKAALRQAKASLRSANAALKNAKANLKNAKTNKEKLKWQKKVDSLEIEIKKQQNAIRKQEAIIKQQEANIKQGELDLRRQKAQTEIAKMQAEIGKATADKVFTETKTKYIPVELLGKAGNVGKFMSICSILGIEIAGANEFLSQMEDATSGESSAAGKYQALEDKAAKDASFGRKWKQFKQGVQDYAKMYTEQRLPLGVSGTP